MLSTSRWNFLLTSPRPRTLMPVERAAHQPGAAKELLVDRRAIFEALLEIIKVDDAVDGLEGRVVEAAFGKSAVQGHLAAFESRADSAARTGFLTLVAFPGGLAMPGTFAGCPNACADAWPRVGFQIVESHGLGRGRCWNFDFQRLAANLENFVLRPKNCKGMQSRFDDVRPDCWNRGISREYPGCPQPRSPPAPRRPQSHRCPATPA